MRKQGFRKYFRLVFILLFSGSKLFSEDVDQQVVFCGEMRVNLIRGWDKLLTWTLTPKIKPYHHTDPLLQKIYEVQNDGIQDFEHEYGYFSFSSPIVGVVSDGENHFTVTNQALSQLEEIQNPEQRNFSQDEMLAKVMAYRSLKKGMKITLPEGGVYLVDQIIDLWKGMPAFGLVPWKNQSNPPILLFRGTDMNLISEKGWASILSDLDTTGPGHLTFLRAREEIHSWLTKVKREYQPARVIGFSLGGAFVLYTLAYESSLLNQEIPSVAFNSPGIAKNVYEKWEKSPDSRVPLLTYVNLGDIVSQIGFFLSDVWEISLEKPMDVIEAHLTLISSQPLYKITAVDAVRENRSRMGLLAK